MVFKPFYFDRQQALIAAKWTVGIRDLALPFGVAPFAVMLLYELLRRSFGVALPAIKYTLVHLCAAVLYLMLIFYLVYRTGTVAKTFEDARFEASFDGGSVIVRRNGSDVYRVLDEDIRTVDYGDRMLRIGSPYGNFCLPRSVVPDAFLTDTKQRGIPIVFRRWM